MSKAKLDRWILGEDEPEDKHAAFHRRERAYKSWCRNHGDAYDAWCEQMSMRTCKVCGIRHDDHIEREREHIMDYERTNCNDCEDWLSGIWGPSCSQ